MACGTGLQAVAPQRSRRIVTVLFADVVGFTSLGERLDPEALSSVLTTYFGAARRIVEDHGGSIEKFIGDAVVAVFGVPAAHEDDALRAVRAAADLQRAIEDLNTDFLPEYGVVLAVRMGVNTGEVAVDGSDPDGSFIFGDTMNTAARLEQHAPPGQILVGRSTYRLVRDHVAVEEMTPLSVKGKAEPVEAVRLVSVVGIGAARPDHTRTFVGREDELATLLDAFAIATAGSACTVTVIGQPGIGKSRLVSQLVEQIGNQARVLIGRCVPYGDGITYWPLTEIVHGVAGIMNNDLPAEALARLRGLTAGEEGLDRAVDHVAHAIGLLDARATAEEIATAVPLLLRRWSEITPIVVVFDDIHWAEPSFLQLVEHLASDLGGASVLVVGLARPELLEAHPDWAERTGGALLKLSPLSRAESMRLVNELLDHDRLAPVLEERLMAASGGNPLFLAQTTTMLLEERLVERVGGVLTAKDELATTIPADLHALLASRIDRLPALEATVLSRAAVLGASFDLVDLESLVPMEVRSELAGLCDNLVRRDLLLHRENDLPGAFRFGHLLIRDAAYEQLTKEDRAALHEAVGGRLLMLYGHRAAEFDELVGYHLEQAFRHRRDLRQETPADRAIGDAAAERLARAGRRASRRGDVGAATGLLARTAALLRHDDQRRARALLDLGQNVMDGGRLEEADALFAEAASIPGTDPLTSALVDVCQGEAALQRDTPGTSTAVLHHKARAALDVFTEHGDERAVLRGGWLLYLTSMHLGRSGSAREAIDHLTVVAEGLGDPLIGRLPGMLAMNLCWGPTPTMVALEQTSALVRKVGDDPAVAPLVLANHGYLLAQTGDIEGARAALATMREMVEHLGQRFMLWAGWSQNRARIELTAGDPCLAEEALREGYDALTEIGERAFASTQAGQLAHALLAQHRDEEAHAYARASRELAGKTDVLSIILGSSAEARVLANAADGDTALELAEDAVALALTTEWPNIQADALLDLGEVHLALGQVDEADRAAVRAVDVFARKGNVAGRRQAELLRTASRRSPGEQLQV